jgi:hypothetical protein
MKFYIKEINTHEPRGFISSICVPGFKNIYDNKTIANIITFYLKDSGDFIKATLYPIKWDTINFTGDEPISIKKEESYYLKDIMNIFTVGINKKLENILEDLPDKYTREDLLEYVLLNEPKYFHILRKGSLDPEFWEYKRCN